MSTRKVIEGLREITCRYLTKTSGKEMKKTNNCWTLRFTSYKGNINLMSLFMMILFIFLFST